MHHPLSPGIRFTPVRGIGLLHLRRRHQISGSSRTLVSPTGEIPAKAGMRDRPIVDDPRAWPQRPCSSWPRYSPSPSSTSANGRKPLNTAGADGGITYPGRPAVASSIMGATPCSPGGYRDPKAPLLRGPAMPRASSANQYRPLRRAVQASPLADIARSSQPCNCQAPRKASNAGQPGTKKEPG